MARSFGETALGLARSWFFGPPARKIQPAPRTSDTCRPEGQVVWVNAPSAADARGVPELIRRILEFRGDLSFLVTLPSTVPVADLRLPFGTPVELATGETIASARAFLDFWRPDLVVSIGAGLPLPMTDQVRERGLPLFLVDGRAAHAGWSWLPWRNYRTRSMLRKFDRILVQNAASARLFRRMGAIPRQLEVAGKMETGVGAMPCTEAERDAMAGFLKSRPVWLAVAVPAMEEAVILSALRQALRLSHRLLLILVPEDPAHGPALAERIERELGMNVSLRSRDEDPDQEDQVYVADTEGEFGLWYRLAPVTFMGGTLLGGSVVRHPFEPAALGSAILHGPMVGAAGDDYTAMAKVGAVRLVRNASELGDAVSDLMDPERAAAMAYQAWTVATNGAEVTDRVVQLILENLDIEDKTKTASVQDLAGSSFRAA